MSLRRGAGAALALTVLLLVPSCGDGPLEPDLPPLEVVLVGGDGQFGTPGQRLDAPLQAQVRRSDSGAPQAGIAVDWSVEEGDAELVTAPMGTTDSQGLVQATVALGATPGRTTVRASVRDQGSSSALFELFVVDRPQLTGVTPASATGGDTVLIRGVGFSPVAGQNVVLFSGIRGRVTAVAEGDLRVEVPTCLPDRSVDVTVQLGLLVSDAVPLDVAATAAVDTIPSGVATDSDDLEGGCLRLPGGRRYLVMVQSAGTVGAARYEASLRGLVSGSGASAPSFPGLLSPVASAASPGTAQGEAALRFEEEIRARERRLLIEDGGARPPVGPAAVEAVVPAVGDARAFKVLNRDRTFDDVQAVARLVSAHAVLYVDETAPAGGFADDELQAFAATFDDAIYPTVTGAFGATSDLDENERVAILFTPTVNRMTPRGADGFIGGFFFGLDLQEKDGSNHGEVFYAMVPDSAGVFSDARSKELVLRVTPAVLAHEFQHMIHFNERMLKLGAPGTEALWLSEGLAQMAEELVARVLIDQGDESAAEGYRAGNRIRARRYLADPAAVSLIVATGQGSLAERGAGWLHTLYLWDRGGDDGVLARLTQTTRTGTDNVVAVTGEPWPDILADWWAALYVDGLSNHRYPFEYPSIPLRDLLREASPYPLSPEVVGGEDFLRSVSLWSSSVRHYIVVPPASGFVALSLGGEGGGGVPADAALRLRIVPLL